MASNTQFDEDVPIITAQSVSSHAEGFGAVSKAFGVAADVAMKQAKALGEDASNANLMSAHSSLRELYSQTQIQMEQDPANGEKYSQKAAETSKNIAANTFVNNADRAKLDYFSNVMTDDLNMKGARKTIATQREGIKGQAINEYNQNLQAVYDMMFTNSEAADKLIDSMIKDIDDKTTAGIFTGVESANFKKGIQGQITHAQHRGSLYQTGGATAKHLAAMNSYQPAPIPYANAGQPMDAHTEYKATAYRDNLSTQDMKSIIASGSDLPAYYLRNIKSDDKYNTLDNFKKGARLGSGLWNSGASWDTMLAEQKRLDSIKTKSSIEEGYKARLDNIIGSIDKRGGFGKLVTETPQGAEAIQEYKVKEDAIDNTIYHGTDEEIANQKNIAHAQNQNEYFTKISSIGVGMDIPDEKKNYIPDHIAQPVEDSFKAGRDPNVAINNIAMLTKPNIVTLSKQMPNLRKSLVVYDLGLAMGKTEKGFETELLASQQDGLDFKDLTPKDSDTEKRMSDNTIRDKLRGNNALVAIQDNYMYQPDGARMVEASMGKAIRYVKFMGYMNRDYTLAHIDEYIDRYSRNTAQAYNITSSYNYNIDANIIPVSKRQAEALAPYAISKVYQELGKYMNPQEVEAYVSKNNPHLVSTKDGRLIVINKFNQAVANEHGKPAFSEFYSDEMQSVADQRAKEFHLMQPWISSPFYTPPTPEKMELESYKREARANQPFRGAEAEASAEVKEPFKGAFAGTEMSIKDMRPSEAFKGISSAIEAEAKQPFEGAKSEITIEPKKIIKQLTSSSEHYEEGILQSGDIKKHPPGSKYSIYPPGVTQADIDRVNKLPPLKGHVGEWRKAWAPFNAYFTKEQDAVSNEIEERRTPEKIKQRRKRTRERLIKEGKIVPQEGK